MKKYQVLSILYLLVCVCTLAVGIVSIFVPTIGVVEEGDGLVVHAAISIFDYAVGDHTAPVVLEGMGDFFGYEINVFEELFGEDSFFTKFNIAIFSIIFMLLGLIVSLISKLSGYKDLSRREKFECRVIELPSLVSFITGCSVIVWVGILFIKLSEQLKTMDFNLKNVYFLPIGIILAIAFSLMIVRIVIANAVNNELKALGADDTVTLFPTEEKMIVIKETREDSIEQLKKYHELLELGILTEEEFNEKKRELMTREGEKK